MSNYAIPLPCGCVAEAYDGGTKGYRYELRTCALHGAADEMRDALKRLLRQERIQRATQATDIGLANAADYAVDVVRKAEGQP